MANLRTLISAYAVIFLYPCSSPLKSLCSSKKKTYYFFFFWVNNGKRLKKRYCRNYFEETVTRKIYAFDFRITLSLIINMDFSKKTTV